MTSESEAVMFHQPLAKHRLFFALMPPIELARHVADAAHWFETIGKPVRADRLHITLAILQDFYVVPDGLIEQLLRTGLQVAAAPFDVVLDRVSARAGLIALKPSHKIAALDALYRQIATLCRAAGIAERPARKFNAHLTLGYRDGRSFDERIAPVDWTAREFLLIHSHLGQTRHEVLGQWMQTRAEGRDPRCAIFSPARRPGGSC
jgi:2'-5' RNA ligase